MVGMSQSVYKFRKQGLGSGEGMGLEYAPDLSVGIVSGSGQACPNLCWVVGVIVNDRESIPFSFVLKAPVGSCNCLLYTSDAADD